MTADQSVDPVDRDLGLVPIDRDWEIDWFHVISPEFRLQAFDGPATVDVLLLRFGGRLGPDLGSGFICLDRRLLAFGIALQWNRDRARIHDLSAP